MTVIAKVLVWRHIPAKKGPETGKNKKPLWREGAFQRVDAIGKECVFESMAFQLRLSDKHSIRIYSSNKPLKK